MAIDLPADSGLDLTATTPTGPQTRDPATFVNLTYRQRARFWRRSQDFGTIDFDSLADKGDLLIDFAEQPLTIGTSKIYTNSLGTYTVTRQTQTHEAQLGGASETQTATGWEMKCTSNSSPGSSRAMRYRLTFSPAIDLSSATNLCFEIEYPQEMNPDDFGNNFYVGIRPLFYSSGSDASRPAVELYATQGIQKRRRTVLYVPLGGALWTTAAGAGCNWSNVTEMNFRMFCNSSNGGFRATIRKIWANRVGKKALVAFTFDDTLKSQYDNALPIFQANGMKAGIATISSGVGTGGIFMSLAELKACYAAGWSTYNHMVDSGKVLESQIAAIASPWSAGTFTVTVSSAVYADAVVGQFWEIRNSWGPEFSGSKELLSKGAGNKLTFDCATQPFLSAGFPLIRADWPGQSRATRITNEVLPCTQFLIDNGMPRGSNVFIAPEGAWDTDWVADMEAAGFVFCRNTGNDYVATNSSPYYGVSGQVMIPDCIDNWDNVAITLDNIADSPANRTEFEGYVDTAIATGQFLHFMGHEVKSAAAPLTVDVALLSHLVGYVKTKMDAGLVQNVTLEQLAAALPADPDFIESDALYDDGSDLLTDDAGLMLVET